MGKDLASTYVLHHQFMQICPSILEQRFWWPRDWRWARVELSKKQVWRVFGKGQERIVDMGVNKIIRLICIVMDMGLNTKVREQDPESD